MAIRAEIEGILVATVTPLTGDGQSVDEAVLAQLIHRLIDARVGGLIPCGSTGEFSVLAPHERKRVVEVTIEAADGRVPVIPQTGALTTAEAVDLSRHAEEAGAAGVMVVPPYYEPPAWADLRAYYDRIASAISIPVMIYHIPSATGQKLTIEEIAELAEIEGVTSIKDSSGDGVLLTEMLQRFRDSADFKVFNGWDTLTFLGLAGGADACVWGAANVIPSLCVELFDAIHKRADLDAARAVWARIWPLCDFLERSSYAAAVKAGCELIGCPAGPPRDPSSPLAETDRNRLAALLQDVGEAATAI